MKRTEKKIKNVFFHFSLVTISPLMDLFPIKCFPAGLEKEFLPHIHRAIISLKELY